MITHEPAETPGQTAAAPYRESVSNSPHASRAMNHRAETAADSPQSLVVRPAGNHFELEQVYRLTYEAYVERGYCRPKPDGKLVHYPQFENISETTVLVALLQKQVMGTVSLTLDGPLGTPMDSDFKATCDTVRAEGLRLAASWRIVTQHSFRGQRQVVMALIGEVVRCAFEDFDLDTFLCSFHPRHESIYRRLLGMRTIARSEGTRGLHGAPAVLMRCDRAAVPSRWLIRDRNRDRTPPACIQGGESEN